MRYVWATGSHVGRVRDSNQDSVYPEDSGAAEPPVVVALADGMGGAVGGDVASRLAIAAATDEGPDAEADLESRVRAAEDALDDEVRRNPRLAGMGTTLSMAQFDDSTADVVHVGDSRIYLLRDGDLRMLTRDHTIPGELMRAGKISPQEAARHPHRHVLTRVIGVGAPVDIDRFEVGLAPGDRLVFCSDGLSDMLTDDTIASILQEADSPEPAVWALIEAANRAGGVDNITVAVVDVEP